MGGREPGAQTALCFSLTTWLVIIDHAVLGDLLCRELDIDLIFSPGCNRYLLWHGEPSE